MNAIRCLLPLLALCLLILPGCDKRTAENAKAAITGDQAVRGAAKVLVSPEFTDPLAGLSEVDRAKVTAAMKKVYALLQTADESLAPVIDRLSIGIPPAELIVSTTVDQAVADPDAFAHAAAGQTARAAAETTDARDHEDFVNWIGQIATGVGDSLLAKLGLGAGTLGLLIGGAAKLGKVYRDNRTTIDGLRTAFVQTVRGLDDARASMGNETWDRHVAPALESAQDQKVKALVSEVQPSTPRPPA